MQVKEKVLVKKSFRRDLLQIILLLFVYFLIIYFNKVLLSIFLKKISKQVDTHDVIDLQMDPNTQIDVNTYTKIIKSNSQDHPFVDNFSNQKNHEINITSIIDKTKNTITIELKKSTKELIEILDSTIVDGKIKIFKGLKGQHLSKKKLELTANNLEKIINDTVLKLDTKNTQKNLIIKENTLKFVAKTKKRAFDMHKNMVCQMRKSIGKEPKIVINNQKQAKIQINEFENKIITKISKFSDRLKHNVLEKTI